MFINEPVLRVWQVHFIGELICTMAESPLAAYVLSNWVLKYIHENIIHRSSPLSLSKQGGPGVTNGVA